MSTRVSRETSYGSKAVEEEAGDKVTSPRARQNRVVIDLERPPLLPSGRSLVIAESDKAQLLSWVALPLLILSSVAIVFVLYVGQDVLQPLCIAIFVSYLIRPLIECITTPFALCLRITCFSRFPCFPKEVYKPGEPEEAELLPAGTHRRSIVAMRRCPRWLAVIVSLVFVLGLITLLALMIANTIQIFERDSLSIYEAQAALLRDGIVKWAKVHLGVDGSYLVNMVQDNLPVSNVVKYTFLYFFNFVTGLFIVFLFTVYLLFENTSQEKIPGGLREKIDAQIQRYIVLKTFISAIVGVGVFVILGPILNVRMASLFAVLTFLFNFIPNVGAVIATLIPAPIVLFDPAFSPLHMVMAFVLPILIHAVVGNFVEPRIFGHELALHPVFLLLSLAFWFAIWGIPGAILSVPMTAVFRMAIDASTHPYAKAAINVMEGRVTALLQAEDVASP
jgi:predicted PurR-regulated permease PerM